MMIDHANSLEIIKIAHKTISQKPKSNLMYISSSWGDLFSGAGLFLAMIAAGASVIGAKLTKMESLAKERASNERIAGLEKETAEANRRTEELKKSNRLSLQQTWALWISKQQRIVTDKMSEALKAAPPTPVLILVNRESEECLSFARGVYWQIKKAGWPVEMKFKEPPATVWDIVELSDDPNGVRIVSNDWGPITPSSTHPLGSLQNGFVDCGIPASTMTVIKDPASNIPPGINIVISPVIMPPFPMDFGDDK